MTINRRSFLRSLPALALIPFFRLPKPPVDDETMRLIRDAEDDIAHDRLTDGYDLRNPQVHTSGYIQSHYATCPIVPKYERGHWSCYCTDQCTPSCPSYPPQWIPTKFACGNDNDPHDHAYCT